jgi:hypothetical protein
MLHVAPLLPQEKFVFPAWHVPSAPQQPLHVEGPHFAGGVPQPVLINAKATSAGKSQWCMTVS